MPRAWLGAVAVCALGTLGPALVLEGKLGVPDPAEGFVGYAEYCVVLLALAIFGVFFVRGRRIPAAVLLGLAVSPAAVGFYAWQEVLEKSRELLPNGTVAAPAAPPAFLPPPEEVRYAALQGFSDLARPIAVFGLAASGCAFLVVLCLAVLAHRAALVHRGLDNRAAAAPSLARVVGALALLVGSALLPLSLHPSAMEGPATRMWDGELRATIAIAIVAACALGGAGAAALSPRLHLLRLEQDEDERGRLWRRAALVPISAAMAALSFETAPLFDGSRRSGMAVASLEAGFALVAAGAPLLRARGALRAGLRARGLPFALSCAVALSFPVGLAVAAGHLHDIDEELARLKDEGNAARASDPP